MNSKAILVYFAVFVAIALGQGNQGGYGPPVNVHGPAGFTPHGPAGWTPHGAPQQQPNSGPGGRRYYSENRMQNGNEYGYPSGCGRYGEPFD